MLQNFVACRLQCPSLLENGVCLELYGRQPPGTRTHLPLIEGPIDFVETKLLMADTRDNGEAARSFTPDSWRQAVVNAKARFWVTVYRASFWLSRRCYLHRKLLYFVVLLAILVAAGLLVEPLQRWLEHRFPKDAGLERFQPLALTLGSALIGATAIVASLVLFAVQVNIERMPHGLFRRLTGDWRLLGAFAAAFLIAITVTFLSTLLSSEWLSFGLLAMTGALVAILSLFFYAYTRALSLINPIHQLQILLFDAQRDLNKWECRSRRIGPIFGNPDDQPTDFDSSKDLFFQRHPQWSNELMSALVHSMSFSVRYAEQGDHEVSAAALHTVVKLNAAYINAKGKTFSNSSPFIISPFASDEVINETLEHVRRNVQTALGRKDEQSLQQCFQTLSNLVHLYLFIPYPGIESDKHHAAIASRYLFESVSSVVPYNMTDVVLGGLRNMGWAASNIIHYGNPSQSLPIIEKVTVLAVAHLARVEGRPVTIEAMGLFSRITFELLRCERRDVRFAFRQLRTNITLVVESVLNFPDPPLTLTHSNLLGPYFSSTDLQSLHSQLPSLVNAIAEADAGNESARLYMSHIDQWMDEAFITHRQLFERAVSVHSSFTTVLIQWISNVAEMLMFLSCAPACEDHLQDALRTHARRMVATLTFIPDDQDSVSVGEVHNLTETFYRCILVALKQDCNEVAGNIAGYLLSWTFKAGKYETGWGTLGLGLGALAVVALRQGEAHGRRLTEEVANRLAQANPPPEVSRQRAADQLLAYAAHPRNLDGAASSIEIGIARAEQEQLTPLLREIANLLHPEV